MVISIGCAHQSCLLFSLITLHFSLNLHSFQLQIGFAFYSQISNLLIFGSYRYLSCYYYSVIFYLHYYFYFLVQNNIFIIVIIIISFAIGFITEYPYIATTIINLSSHCQNNYCHYYYYYCYSLDLYLYYCYSL